MKQFLQLERASVAESPKSNGHNQHLTHEANQCIASAQQCGETLEDRLDSWKEVAAYLRREVRTVQRWEKREGLPVHRHFHNQVGSIYAFKTEINEWRRGRSPSLCAMVSQRKHSTTVSNGRLSRGRLESHATVLYRADQSPWKREKEGKNEGLLPAIIYLPPDLLALTGDLKSLCLEDLLVLGTSGKVGRVCGLAASSEPAQGNKR